MAENTRIRLEPMMESGLAAFRDHYINHYTQAYTNEWRSRETASSFAREDFDEIFREGLRAENRTFLSIMENQDGRVLGELVVLQAAERGEPALFLEWIWLEPQFRGQGFGTQALTLFETSGIRADVAFLVSAYDPESPSLAALFRKCGFQRTGVMMRMNLSKIPPNGPATVQLAPLNEEEWATASKQFISNYMKNLQHGTFPIPMKPESVEELAHRDQDSLAPEGVQTPGHTMAAIRDSGREVGTIWFGVRDGGDIKAGFLYEILVREEFRNRGYGEAAMRLAGQCLYEQGCKYMDFHVFGHNTQGIRFYERLGCKATCDLVQKTRFPACTLR